MFVFSMSWLENQSLGVYLTTKPVEVEHNSRSMGMRDSLGALRDVVTSSRIVESPDVWSANASERPESRVTQQRGTPKYILPWMSCYI